MTVLTPPNWLYIIYKGYRNEHGTAFLHGSLDAQGRPIIGKQILDDPDFDLTIEVTSPEGETKPIKDWLVEIEFEPVVVEDFEVGE